MGLRDKTSDTSTMKVFVVILSSLIAICLGASLQSLIQHEVKTLLMADHALTIDHCTTKCDALFDLVSRQDEHATDKMCKHYCTCGIQKNCTSHNHGHKTTAAPVAPIVTAAPAAPAAP